jgi:hypothetical protein
MCIQAKGQEGQRIHCASASQLGTVIAGLDSLSCPKLKLLLLLLPLAPQFSIA